MGCFPTGLIAAVPKFGLLLSSGFGNVFSKGPQEMTAEPNPRIHYPPPLAHPQFIAAFEGEWLPYLASNNQRMPSNFTVDSQLRQMASHNDVQTAIDCMQSAIRLGLRAPLKNRPRATPTASQPEPVNAGTIAL
jgi:hypothetical protein